jgi:hypothetical protein
MIYNFNAPYNQREPRVTYIHTVIRDSELLLSLSIDIVITLDQIRTTVEEHSQSTS